MSKFQVAIDSEQSAHAPEAVAASLWKLVKANRLCSIATVSAGSRAHINTCFFGPTPELSLVVFTAPSSRHGQNLSEDSAFAAAVFDSSQEWGGIIYGAQLFGTAKICDSTDADRAFQYYIAHNPKMGDWAKNPAEIEAKFESRLYVLNVMSFTLLDEASFGKESYINGSVSVTA